MHTHYSGVRMYLNLSTDPYTNLEYTSIRTTRVGRYI